MVAPVGWVWFGLGRLPLKRPSSAIVALLVTGAYLLINASWSLSPWSAVSAVAQFFTAVAVLYLTLEALDQCDEGVLRAMAWGIVTGVAVAAGILCLEVFSGQWARRAIMVYVPALQIGTRQLIVENGHTVSAYGYLLNRSISALGLLFWPTLLLIDRLQMAHARRRWVLVALLPASAAILGSAHATSKMAFLGAVAVYGLFRYSARFARRLAVGAWVSAMLLVVPLAAAAYEAKLYEAHWLPMSAQQRIVIWGYTSAQIGNAPVFGSGIGSARALSDLDGRDMPHAPGTDFELTTHVHSHNAYLQIWFETGAIGAFLFLLTGLAALQRCTGAPAAIQRYLFSSFAAGALLAASSFSIWAPWLLASFAMTAIFVSVGVALSPSSPPKSAPHTAEGRAA
jgi:hypothetical protein